MGKLIIFIPFFYFLKSRLNSFKNLIFHSYYEWIPAFLILVYLETYSTAGLAKGLLLSYLAFISIYEIGYFINDFYSTKFEKNPRPRINEDFASYEVVSFIFFRLLVFSLCTYILGFHFDLIWYTFYITLIISFLAHNTITIPAVKTVTFLNLSFYRFFAPIFMFLSEDNFKNILLPIILNYCIFRMLTYMDSKNLLNFTERKTPSFKLAYYLLLIPIHVIIALLNNSNLPLLILCYFLLFNVVYYFIESVKSKISH